jgi:hypothetical protein
MKKGRGSGNRMFPDPEFVSEHSKIDSSSHNNFLESPKFNNLIKLYNQYVF